MTKKRSKRTRSKRKHQHAPKSNVVWKQTAEEATLANKPYINAYTCGYGVQGDAIAPKKNAHGNAIFRKEPLGAPSFFLLNYRFRSFLMRKAPAAIAPITPSVRLPLYFTNAFASTRSVNPQNIVLGDKNPLYKETMQYIIVMQDIYCILSKAVFLLENGKNERMKQSRIDAGLSQQQLADAVGATRQTIGLIEAGRYNPSLKLCTAICKTLGKTLDDLFWE